MSADHSKTLTTSQIALTFQASQAAAEPVKPARALRPPSRLPNCPSQPPRSHPPTPTPRPVPSVAVMVDAAESIFDDPLTFCGRHDRGIGASGQSHVHGLHKMWEGRRRLPSKCWPSQPVRSPWLQTVSATTSACTKCVRVVSKPACETDVRSLQSARAYDTPVPQLWRPQSV